MKGVDDSDLVISCEGIVGRCQYLDHFAAGHFVGVQVASGHVEHKHLEARLWPTVKVDTSSAN